MADKITAEQLKSQETNFVILDVREPDELESGKIDSSTHMPLGLTIRNVKKKQIEQRLDLLKKEYESALIVEPVIEEILQPMNC